MCPSFSPTCVQMVRPILLHNISAGLHSMRYSIVLSMFQNCTSAVSAVFYATVRFTTDACTTLLSSLNYIVVNPQVVPLCVSTFTPQIVTFPLRHCKHIF